MPKHMFHRVFGTLSLGYLCLPIRWIYSVFGNAPTPSSSQSHHSPPGLLSFLGKPQPNPSYATQGGGFAPQGIFTKYHHFQP